MMIYERMLELGTNEHSGVHVWIDPRAQGIATSTE